MNKLLIVKVKNIIFRKQETPFVIFKASIMKKGQKNLKETSKTVTLLGDVLNVMKNDIIEVEAEQFYRSGDGYQYRILHYKRIAPGTLAEMKKFLMSFEGIGDKNAKILLDEHGLDVITKIEESYTALANIKLSSDKKTLLRDQIVENKIFEDILVFLLENKLDQQFAIGILRKYKAFSITMLKNSAYVIYLEGFLDFYSADYLCLQQGLQYNNPLRVSMVLYATMKSSSENKGNLFENIDDIFKLCSDFSRSNKGAYVDHPEYTAEEIKKGIEELKERNFIILDDKISDKTAVYLKRNFFDEVNIAKYFSQIKYAIKPCHILYGEIMAFFQKNNHIYGNLTEAQKEAVVKALTSPMSIITGGPGTGKTYVTQAILHAIKTISPNAVVELAAPTGKAAHRMQEVTGQGSKTIHRLIKSNTIRSDEDDLIDADFLIVDEYSMADAELTAKLFMAFDTKVRIIFVGDFNQLPSVGPGLVLREFIYSEKITVTMLEAVFRQKGESLIVSNANSIINYSHTNPLNLKICNQMTSEQDFFFIKKSDPLEIQNTLISTISNLQLSYGYSLKDIQILSPVKSSELGTESLNSLLQDHFNKSSQSYSIDDREFKVGDKVIHLVNNYDLDVFNGDAGVVKAIGTSLEKALLVMYGSRSVWYDRVSLDELSLAYAMTVHKSQGSEFKVVIMPIHKCILYGLNQNLIYTAVTRAKEKVVFVGEDCSFLIGVEKKLPARNSNLIKRLNLEI